MKFMVVVDMQNDFITGSLGTPEAKAIVPNVVERINAFNREEGGILLVGTLDTHDKDYADTLEGKLLPVLHCIKGTEGWKLHPSIEELVDVDYFCEKPTFGSLDLMVKLSAVESLWPDPLTEIEIMGLCTDICVISNALLLRAAFPNVPIKVYANCCAGTTPEKHEAALKVMESCQIEVIR